MKKGIVVVTHENNKDTWLQDCLSSMPDDNGIVDIYTNTDAENHYEGGGLAYGFERYDEFWLIPDTVVIKNFALVQRTLADDGVGYSAGPCILSCVGKFRRSVMERAAEPLRVPQNKREAVYVELLWVGGHYLQAEDNIICLSESFVDGPRREFKHGRENMVIESDTFIKYKGCWDLSMIKDGS